MTVLNCNQSGDCLCLCRDCLNRCHEECYNHNRGCHMDCGPLLRIFGWHKPRRKYSSADDDPDELA